MDMIGPEQFASRLSGLPPSPFDNRDTCPICAGPPGACVRGPSQQHVDQAAQIRAFAEERAKLQTRGPRMSPDEAHREYQAEVERGREAERARRHRRFTRPQPGTSP